MAEMRLDNTRDPEQRRIMEEQKKLGICHFCRDGFEGRHGAPILHEQDFWFITANSFPYEGSVHHYLIVNKRHITKISDLSPEEQGELFQMISWLENHLGVTGESIFVRSGNMAYTGATLDHIHFHFIVGVPKTSDDPEQRILITLGYKKQTL